MDQPVDAISNNLRTLRENRSLSLDQLSELTGVSKSMLRQIETGKSSPTISTIWKIANGLHISFTSLLRTPVVQAEVRSFRDDKPVTAEAEHCRVFPLIPFEPQQSFETYFFELDPNTATRGEPHKGNVYEYIFLTKGRLRITVAGKRFEICEGEFLQFQANVLHEYECISEETATAIIQISYLP